MKNILKEICHAKRAHISAQQQRVPFAVLEKQCRHAPPTRGFAKALRAKVDAKQVALITEIKKASPSKGVLRAAFQPAQHARDYAAAGATCLSVLTDTPYFQGSDADLVEARAACALPILRKDFMLDPYQIYESRALGADAVLLIMAALSDAEAKRLEDIALSLGLDVLIEVHDAAELQRALALRSPLIGINNRNLKTLQVDTNTALTLVRAIPAERLVIAESGIRTHEDIQSYQQQNIHAFLVGESLMTQADLALATENLRGA